MNSSFSLSAVVVLVPQHLKFVARLLRNLNQAHPQFDEVVVVASGLSWREKREIIRELSQITVPLTVEFPKLGSAGANRNIGARSASGDLLAFLDADDLYAPGRNEVIRRAYLDTGFDIFLHSFVDFCEEVDLSEQFSDPTEFDSSKTYDQRILSQLTFPDGERNRELEVSGNAPSTNLIIPQESNSFAVHHAHVVAKRGVALQTRFHEYFGVRNEDGVFARDVLFHGGKVIVCPLVLSGYQQGARAKPRPKQSLRARLIAGIKRIRSPFMPYRQAE